MASLLAGEKPPIHLSRRGGAPAALFNPTLAIFQRELENLDQVQVSRLEVESAAKYLQSTVIYYKDEAQRQQVITSLVNEAIGEKGEWGCALGWADNIKPNGCWWYLDFLILVLELKNTLGLSGDALLQAAIDYSKIVPHEEYKLFREYSNFPIVLVGATKYYDLISKFFPPKLSCLYPDPTPVDMSKTLPKLVYKQSLSRTGQAACFRSCGPGKHDPVMYIATNQEVVVKFTARYNETAHRILAEAQLAPRLHFCERVVGDLYMVMNFVDGKSLWQLREDEAPVPEIISKKVETALNLLHAQGIVFADLRDPNIVYIVSKGSDEGCIMLVDFDWPAKDGEGRYPAMLNPNNAWSDDVSPYGIMQKSHDLWQLDRLKALT